MQIKYMGEYSYSVITPDGKRVTFHKGNNFIEDKFWDEIKNNPLVKERLTTGLLLLVVTRTEDTEIIDETKKQEPEKIEIETPELELDNLNVQDANEMVRQCVSEETLKRLLKKEKRAGVRDAINAQLKKLKEVENV